VTKIISLNEGVVNFAKSSFLANKPGPGDHESRRGRCIPWIFLSAALDDFLPR